MLHAYRNLFRPEAYHGHGRKPPFFEGWYFKLVDAQQERRFAVIPGVYDATDPAERHAFVQLFDDYGDELNGGTINSYAGGTSTPKATYTDSTGGATNANPIVLDAAGRDQGGIWLTEGEAYKFILKKSDGTTLDTIDNAVVGDVADRADEAITTLAALVELVERDPQR